MLTLQEITRGFAEKLSTELARREIVLATFEPTVQRQNIWTELGAPKFFQVPVAMLYNSHERTGSLESYLSAKQNAIKEMAIKVARPFETQFAMLEVPKNVHEAALAVAGDVVVRGVTDYMIAFDALITRFDCVVSWKDAEDPIFAVGPALPMTPELAA
jgi:hypothetical protein